MSTVRATVTPELIAALAADYKTGNFTQGDLATKFNLCVPTVNKLLKGCEKPEKRKYTVSAERSERAAAIAVRNAAIVADWKAGASTRALASQHNVTHQNISLIIKAAGFAPVEAHKERLGVQAAARAEKVTAEKGAKAASKREKLEKLSALWKSGAKIGELREFAGLKSDNAMQVKIVLLRRKHPELFPKRNSQGGVASEEKLAKIEALSALWLEGKTVEECATAVGWSKATFRGALPSLQKSHPEKFPIRPAIQIASNSEVDDFTAPQG